jgi:hypothetical protein
MYGGLILDGIGNFRCHISHGSIYICVYIYIKQRKNRKTKFLWGCNGNRTNGYDVYFYVLIDVEKMGILAWPTSWIPLGSEGF